MYYVNPPSLMSVPAVSPLGSVVLPLLIFFKYSVAPPPVLFMLCPQRACSATVAAGSWQQRWLESSRGRCQGAASFCVPSPLLHNMRAGCCTPQRYLPPFISVTVLLLVIPPLAACAAARYLPGAHAWRTESERSCAARPLRCRSGMPTWCHGGGPRRAPASLAGAAACTGRSVASACIPRICIRHSQASAPGAREERCSTALQTSVSLTFLPSMAHAGRSELPMQAFL